MGDHEAPETAHLVPIRLQSDGDYFPFVVAAPHFFTRTIQLGGLMQTAWHSGGSDCPLLVFRAYIEVAEWRATVDRLTSFYNDTERARLAAQDGAGIQVTNIAQPNFASSTSALRCRTARRWSPRLISAGSTQFRAHDRTFGIRQEHAVPRSPASGHSAAARFSGPPPLASVFAAEPYLGVGKLRDQLMYPAQGDAFTDGVLSRALLDCGLPQLARAWTKTELGASVVRGEQQRVAFARAALQTPVAVYG